MTGTRLFVPAVMLCMGLLLDGCASNSASNVQGELATSSDKTERQKRALIRLQLAIGYYQQGQTDVALDEVKRALQADPDLADAHSMRGLIYMDMKESRLAEDSFLQALRLDSASPDANNNYGWFLCQNGRAKQSIAYFENALKSRSYQSPGKALNNAGVCSLKLKDSVAAERYFAQALQYDPGNPTTNTNLARSYYEKGDYERARFYINRVLKADVMSADVLWIAIKTAHRLGDALTEKSLGTQLRRRYPNAREYAAYQRGAFDE